VFVAVTEKYNLPK